MSAPSTVAALRRLQPFVRPILPALVGSVVTAVVATLVGLCFPLVIQWIVDGPLAEGSTSGLWVPGLVLVGMGLVEAFLFWVRRMLLARPSYRVEADIRSALYDRLQSLPVEFHDRFPAGQLLSRAVSDLATIRRFLAFGLVFLVVNVMTFVVGVGILLVLSWQLGLIVAALALPLIVLCLIYERKYQVLARRAQDQVGDLTTTVEESILGIRILKAFGRGRHLARLFRAEAVALAGTELKKARAIAMLWSAIIALPEIALGLALWLGIHQVADGTLTTGALIAFVGVAMGLRWPIDSIGWLLAMANEAGTAAARVMEVLDEPVTITSPTDPVPARHSGGRVDFRGVGFRFPGATDPLLHDLDLVLEPGETVALVGATGSGKTTVTGLVNRLYDVTAGSITLDGVDLRDLDLTELRRSVHAAFEDPTLFSASVRENLLVGHPDATDAEIEQALQVASAGFVHDLPFGLDTRIGEQGMALSGGQRQRLALARAVIGRPRVLVLDDPLSALDVHTEAEVEQALRDVLRGTTALVVAHRASTVQMADKVALLADGRIVAVGPHSELLATRDDYRHLLSHDEPATSAAVPGTDRSASREVQP